MISNIYIIQSLILFSTINLSGQTLTGHWELISYVHPISNEIIDRKAEDNNDGKLTFWFLDDSINGSITGKTTTNRVRGNYILYHNDSIRITRFGGTKIAEYGWGREFDIRNATSFKILSDTLIIYCESNINRLKFVKLED